MAEEHTFLGYLGPEFQEKCLWQLLTDSEFAEKTIPLLEISYFDDPTYKRFFAVMTQYMESYERPPSLKDKSILIGIRKFVKKTDKTEIELLDAVAIKIKNWNDMVINKDIPHNGSMIQKETLNFIKQQEYRKIASFIQSNVQEGNNSDEFLFEIEEKTKKIGDIGAEDDMGIEIMDNINTALRKEFRKAIPTGIDGIDALTKGGLGGGEMGIILAGTGVGKSTILTYIANTAYNRGHNVLQIIFEDKPDEIRRKHFAKWTKIPLEEMDDRAEEVKDKIHEWHKNNPKHGKLIIKKFPQENTTMPKVRQYIEKCWKKDSLKFDIIILDYIDVLESHKKSFDQNASELNIVKAFEGMADELNIPCWTAIQTNRSGYNAELIDTSQMSGNIKRAQKTHFLMSVAKTAEQKIDGQANIAILKARMAQDGHVFRDCVFDNNTMEIRITDEILPKSTQKLIVDEGVKAINNMDEQLKAHKENQEPEEYIKYDDTVEGFNKEKADDILEKMHKNEDVSNQEKEEINRRLAELSKSQSVMKK